MHYSEEFSYYVFLALCLRGSFVDRPYITLLPSLCFVNINRCIFFTEPVVRDSPLKVLFAICFQTTAIKRVLLSNKRIIPA